MFKEAFASHTGELRTLQKLQHSRMAAVQHEFEEQLDSMATEFVECVHCVTNIVVFGYRHILKTRDSLMHLQPLLAEGVALLECREAAAHRQCHERQQAAIAEHVRALEAQKVATRKRDESVLAAQKEAIVNADTEDQAVLR
jgi:hypothetical protein